MNVIQPDLFVNSRPELPPELESQFDVPRAESRLNEWSYSRREVFEKCQRLYYYQYYGASTRHAKADPEKQRLRFLKEMSNRYMRAGDIMHWAISAALRGRAKGREWSAGFLLEFARKKFREDVAFSENYKEGTPFGETPSSPRLLMEFYYKMPGAKQLCSQVEENLLRALQSFLAAAEYLPFRMGVDGGRAKIESPISVKHQGVTLRGKVDLAFKQDGRSIIVDWKMGQGEGGEDSLQLLFYALWAM